jgi:hypothetical protein
MSPAQGARLDVGRALPRPAEAFVVALCRFHGEADGGDGRVGAQAQVGPEDVAAVGHVRQRGGHAAGRADELGAGVEVGVAGVARLVEEHDEVDVGRVVELPCPHLAHGERHHPAGGGEVSLRHARQLAARHEGFEFGAKRGGGGGVGEPCQRVGDRFERPDAAEVGERHEERRAALGGAEAGGGVLRREGGGLGEEAVESGLWREGQGVLAPCGLAVEEAAEVRGAAARAADEVGEFRGQAREGAESFRGEVGLERTGRAGDAGGEGGHGTGGPAGVSWLKRLRQVAPSRRQRELTYIVSGSGVPGRVNTAR